MKTRRITTFCILVILPLATSHTALSSTSEHQSHGKLQATNKSNRKELPGKTKSELVNVFVANEKLHQTLFHYDDKRVASAAKALAKSMTKVSDPVISKKLAFSISKLNEIVAGKPRAEVDQNYHLVSMALIHLLKTYDIGKDYDAYSCPMVKKKWVQNSTKTAKVHNPYAPNMPHCGSQDTKFNS